MNGPARALRVLTVTNMYPQPDRPTLGTFVGEEVEALRRCGVKVDVLFVDGPASKFNYIRGAGAIRRAADSGTSDGPYDLIHAHYVFCGMMALAAMARPAAAGRSQRLPIVLTQHGIEVQEGWTAPLSRWTSRRVDRTIATSPRVAKALGAAPMSLLPCGVNTDLFCPMPKVEARHALGLNTDVPVVLFVGAPRPEKRLPLIEAAVTELRKTLPAAQLLLVHGEARERIPLYMNAADALVLASVAEGSPMVVREALACNLPVVSTDVGDVSALIEGLPGCHIAGPEPTALAEKLALSLQLGQRPASRDRILPWSLEQVAGRLEEVYREVLSQFYAGGRRPAGSRVPEESLP